MGAEKLVGRDAQGGASFLHFSHWHPPLCAALQREKGLSQAAGRSFETVGMISSED